RRTGRSQNQDSQVLIAPASSEFIFICAQQSYLMDIVQFPIVGHKAVVEVLTVAASADATFCIRSSSLVRVIPTSDTSHTVSDGVCDPGRSFEQLIENFRSHSFHRYRLA